MLIIDCLPEAAAGQIARLNGGAALSSTEQRVAVIYSQPSHRGGGRGTVTRIAILGQNRAYLLFKELNLLGFNFVRACRRDAARNRNQKEAKVLPARRIYIFRLPYFAGKGARGASANSFQS